eukprot:CAMPEP_0184869808 /NCGR_PEP_ID=MMETSP0580-20130426/35373_1 /TAXON_ID=1118495 /ORGANISM="Dactyliosolen fragilissimus" /LENGTH=181 /DNA_ID=CAMNT_0027371537 /DNA_START=55 /DNA_END=600 /DNA_ORIENTATION=+
MIFALFMIFACSTTGLSLVQTNFQSDLNKNWGLSNSVPGVENLSHFKSSSALVARRNPMVMMPATLERPAVRTSGGPAILDRPVVEKKKESSPAKQKKRSGSEAWEVRIYNDGTNTREFVARCLVQITGLSEITAYQTMMQAHQNGLAVVGRYVYELAEMYYEALKKNGIVCDLVPVDEER